MQNNLARQDDIREELIGGRAVAMSPRPNINHNFICGNLYVLFANYLKGRSCTPFADGTDLYLSEDDVFIPDMMVVCDRRKIQRDGVHGAPDLVVEVLSPGTASRDRGYKMDAYARFGVREYWIVSPESKSVEVYRSDGNSFVFHDAYTVHPDWMLERMTPEERAAVTASFRCCLYDDLEISLDDIFSGLLP